MKKHTAVTISLSLVVFLMISFLAGASPVVAANHTLTNVTDDTKHILFEDTSRRKEYEKHFLMSDGSYQVALYNDPVHKLEGGNWVEIDNTLTLEKTRDGVGQYVTTNGLVDVSFAEGFDEQLVTIRQENYSVSWGLYASSGILSRTTPIEPNRSAQAEVITSDASAIALEEQKTLATKASSTIQYRGALASGVDLEYVVQPSKIKENIILHSKQDISCYTVALCLENLSARLLGNREIEFYNENEVVFTMTSPYMYDSAGELTENIAVELSFKGNGSYDIKMTPDAQWLSSKDRVYPVVIDPQISVSTARSNIIDNYVLEGAGNQNRNLDRLYIGNKSGKIARAFIKYDTLPTIPANCTVTDATMIVTLRNGTSTAANASAYKVTGGDWASDTITWANMPGSTLIVSNISHNNKTGYTFSCDSAVQSWYSGSTTGSNANYGIMLRYYNESIDDYNSVYSADYTDESKRPLLIIYYTGTSVVPNNKTFVAFDVGDSSADEVALVAEHMRDMGYTAIGLYDNADGNVSASTIRSMARNANIVYINSHGGQYANIYIYDSRGNRTSSCLCADESVSVGGNFTTVGVGAQWKNGSTTKTTSYWNNGTEWVILAPCSQLDYSGSGIGVHWNGLTSAEVWARTMLGDGERIHGYLGYFDSAPGTAAHMTKLDNFYYYCKDYNYTIVDAWIEANDTVIGTANWAAIYHSANANDRFQSMSSSTANGAAYEIYYISEHVRTEEEMDLESRNVSVTQNTFEDNQIIPQFTNTTASEFSADAMYATLSKKLDISESTILNVEDNGRITYSVGRRDWGKSNLKYEITDSEAILIAKQELDKLGLLPQNEYRAVVSRIDRTKMDLSGKQRNEPETVEYSVRFFRTYNGVDVISEQDDGIMVKFNKDGLTGLKYYWRELDLSTSNRETSKAKISMREAQEAYKAAIDSGKYISTIKSADDEMASAIATIAYMQIGDQVKPVWVFSTNSCYANSIFVDMYTGQIVNS